MHGTAQYFSTSTRLVVSGVHKTGDVFSFFACATFGKALNLELSKGDPDGCHPKKPMLIFQRWVGQNSRGSKRTIALSPR